MNHNKLLIVVDMQNDFIDGALKNKQALNILDPVKKKIENWDGYITYTMDTHKDNYLNTQEGKKLPVPHCIEGTEGYRLTDKIPFTPVTDNAYLKKVYYKNGFGSKELVEDLTKMVEIYGEPETIELVGLCTDICVIVNALALKAALPEVNIQVDASCTAGITPLSEREALNAMKMCQIDIIQEEK